MTRMRDIEAAARARIAALMGPKTWGERDLNEHDADPNWDRDCYTLPNGDCVGACEPHNGYDKEQGELTDSIYPHPLLFTHSDSDLYMRPPARAHGSDCGYDLFVAEDTVVHPMVHTLVSHNLKIQLPPGTWGLLVGRSSNWSKMLEVGTAIIDNGYRGELFARVLNLSDKDIHLSQGDRVAQLILVQMFVPPTLYVEELSDSDRGTGGFGSTGR